MSYTLNRTFPDASLSEIDSRTRAALADQGFGVLTEIDVKATLKKKIDVDVDPYVILGACNPKMAHQAIGMEPHIGVMLPCNVILRQVGKDVEVSAIDPMAAFAPIENDALEPVAGEVKQLLQSAIDAI
jgi:uncharacterized protein (DUF302 family)